MDLTAKQWDVSIGFIRLIVRGEWRSSVKTAMSHRIPQNRGKISDGLRNYQLGKRFLFSTDSYDRVQHHVTSVMLINHPPYTIHHAPYTIHNVPCTIHHIQCTMHHTPYTIHNVPCTIHHTPPTPFARHLLTTTSSPPSQKMSCVLCNSEARCHVQNSPPLVHILSQLNPSITPIL
jgi:hypothetical protein